MQRRRTLSRPLLASLLALTTMLQLVGLPGQASGCGTGHEDADCCCANAEPEVPASSCCDAPPTPNPVTPTPATPCGCEVQEAPSLPAIPEVARPAAAPKVALSTASQVELPCISGRVATHAAPEARLRAGPPLRLLFCVSQT